MKWKTLTCREQEKRNRETQWQDWFAWHPVCIGDHWFWLERIQRRLVPRVVALTYYVEHWVYRELDQ